MRNHWSTKLVYVALAVYTCALLVTEFCTSQDFVRNFFTDVEGPVPLYAVNTTLSVSLLWGAALLFGICSYCARESAHKRASLFYLSQAAVFFWLGFDDRFQFHEKVAYRLGIKDEYVLLVVAAIEFCLLVQFARQMFPRAANRRLIAAAVLSAVMIVVDGWFPHDAVLRLSFEDLLKTWACFLFLSTAWETLKVRIELLKNDNVASSPGLPREQPVTPGLSVDTASPALAECDR